MKKENIFSCLDNSTERDREMTSKDRPKLLSKVRMSRMVICTNGDILIYEFSEGKVIYKKYANILLEQ